VIYVRRDDDCDWHREFRGPPRLRVALRKDVSHGFRLCAGCSRVARHPRLSRFCTGASGEILGRAYFEDLK